jgi:hypothetical protein
MHKNSTGKKNDSAFQFPIIIDSAASRHMHCNVLETAIPFFHRPKKAGVRRYVLRKTHDMIIGLFGRFAVVGERLSPYISIGCMIMAVVTLFLR